MYIYVIGVWIMWFMKVATDNNVLQLPVCYTVMADKVRRRRVPC